MPKVKKTDSTKKTAKKTVKKTTKVQKVAKPKKRLNSKLNISRVIIEKVEPEIDAGLFPIKRTVGESVIVEASIFTDGHDEVAGIVMYKAADEKVWQEVDMEFLGNDRWSAEFTIEKELEYTYKVCAYGDEFGTWKHGLEKKKKAAQNVSVELLSGALMLESAVKRASAEDKKSLKQFVEIFRNEKCNEFAAAVALGDEVNDLVRRNIDTKKLYFYPRELKVNVERKRARFSSWYEFFPRSWAKKAGKHGTFKDSQALLPEIAKMGFNVVYLPPIHPIGEKHRKGKNNSVVAQKGDTGCPWAIGSKKGGHKAVHPELGTLKDFDAFVKEADKNGLEIALDIAFQCAPDHPYVKKHPQWFKWRPDGTVQYAENPPKKYEDVLPINFDTDDWENLWYELKSVVTFWVKRGVKIFRVDNPHTKAFRFWDWCIEEVRNEYPDVIFLAEAFTRPSVMARLAKGGFSQSYTYFTWRNTKAEFVEYMGDLNDTEQAEYMRPNFWPNTPDILPYHLQNGGRPAFIQRAVLAATLSSNWGLYGPAYELCVADPMAGKEEYLNSEKYEPVKWDWNQKGNIKKTLTTLNMIRNVNECLQYTNNIKFLEIQNDNILAYCKYDPSGENALVVVVNLDPFKKHAGTLEIPLELLGIEKHHSYEAKDLLNNHKYDWHTSRVYVELDPQKTPAHIFKFSKK